MLVGIGSYWVQGALLSCLVFIGGFALVLTTMYFTGRWLFTGRKGASQNNGTNSAQMAEAQKRFESKVDEMEKSLTSLIWQSETTESQCGNAKGNDPGSVETERRGAG